MKENASAAAVLRVEDIDGVLWLTKTNPEDGYGMSGALIEAMHAALSRARNDPGTRGYRGRSL